MKKLITIGIILLITITSLQAQSDFRSGYIIKNDNDTVYGFLDYKGSKANAKKCIFRKNIDSENQVFTPEELKGYRFTDSKYYISKSIITENQRKQLFLEYLINGIVNVYYYRDNKREHYFIENEKGDLYELKNEEKEVIRNDKEYIKETKEYIGLLRYTFKDSPSISRKVNNVSLTHKSLINITYDYHNEVCSDKECVIYEKKLPKIKCSYGLTIGYNGIIVTEMANFDDERYYWKNSDFGFSKYPSIGLYCKMNMPFLNERLFFQYEGTYSRVKQETANSYTFLATDMKELNNISLTQDMFNSLVLLKYEFPKGKIRPTFQLGGFMNYSFKVDYKRAMEVKYSWGDTYYTRQFDENPFNKLNFGINCGVGIKTTYLKGRELFLDLRYQRGFGFFDGFNTNNISINTGFQIGK